MKLISMTDFVLEQGIKTEVQSLTEQWSSRVSRYNKIMSYAQFLKQPLELWMFVPCDDDGILLEIIPFNIHRKGSNFEHEQHERYQQAKERCLFEGFEVQNTKDWIEFYGGIRVYLPSNDLGNMVSVVFKESEPMNKIIEDLVKYNLQLTPTAQKLIVL